MYTKNIHTKKKKKPHCAVNNCSGTHSIY